ncbi:MAG: VOC family protein [Saprospiraceae bacterium]
MKKDVILLVSVLCLTIACFSFTSKKSIDMDFGTSYLALSVKDIAVSYAFYQKLGFEALPGAGGVEQKWMVLKNGQHKIGLFQGMFPKNTMTYNPTDLRSIYKHVVAQGLETAFASGMDKEAGPCTFSIIDPDGNPILFDQH